ncbi:MAG: tRNA lysidine(34) synthetase TilS [bacterium]|nr:tRNA lysidine(34) synthetase TilS [bacterium]
MALSGGADSVALLVALRDIGCPLTAAHVNYGLRGAESDADEQYVRDLCRCLGIPLKVLHADVPARIKRDGISLEMACRDIRYEWFEALRTASEGAVVAVAHHRDDNVETFMLNALRGTGIAGLRGMEPRRSPGIVRPMLGLSRADIEVFLSGRGIDWRTDSSNAVADVKRNRVRLMLMPTIRQAFGEDAPERIAHTMEHLADDERLLLHLIDNERRAVTTDDGALDVAEICRRHPEVAASLIYKMMRGTGLTREMAAEIAADPMRPSATFSGFTLTLGLLTLRCNEVPEPRILTSLSDGPWTVTELEPEEFAPGRDARIAWFDADALPDAAVWELRTRRNGDRMRPFGMRGTRLLSDIYAGAKLTPAQRISQPVLTCNGVITWLPGLANAQFAPVTPSTRHILRLEYSGGNPASFS